MEGFPGRSWIVSHKVVAVAAQLGRMGLHRSVIHPKFGSFILLATVLTEAEIEGQPAPLTFDPCVGCKLCVAACPVGAIEPDGTFRFSACYDHNYREFMTGFSDFAEEIADSRDRQDFRDRVPLSETVSLWQSLAYKPNYKAAYCLAVCPAGEDVLGPFIDARARHVERIVRPLQQKTEPLYVVAGSDAEQYAAKRYPHKRLRRVHSGIRPMSINSFLRALPWLFQRGQSEGLAARYHFVFRGAEPVEATIDIRDGKIDVQPGLSGKADVRVVADSRSWVRFLRKETPLAWLLLTRRLRLSPMPRGAMLLGAFGKCFPS
jgi:NAD-dependent dihydropyrimidine dehydrogenase PreA subunit